MVRTKLVPKRIKIRQWPPREPYTQFKIKTLLPEQKTVQIKKNGQVIRTVTVRRKTKKIQTAGQEHFNGKETGLQPNWDEHNATKCPIINYFADRENTELILLRQESEIENGCFLLQYLQKMQKN